MIYTTMVDIEPSLEEQFDVWFEENKHTFTNEVIEWYYVIPSLPDIFKRPTGECKYIINEYCIHRYNYEIYLADNFYLKTPTKQRKIAADWLINTPLVDEKYLCGIPNVLVSSHKTLGGDTKYFIDQWSVHKYIEEKYDKPVKNIEYINDEWRIEI